MHSHLDVLVLRVTLIRYLSCETYTGVTVTHKKQEPQV